MCGEQLPSNHSRKDNRGSPPRVRGTVSCTTSLICLIGITPACAGNSMSENIDVDRAQDHPRVCGEQLRGKSDCSVWEGSPPRVRGTVVVVGMKSAHSRITPACAGNRGCCLRPRTWFEDHPRVCGEQPSIFKLPGKVAGSPPRVRGTG